MADSRFVKGCGKTIAFRRGAGMDMAVFPGTLASSMHPLAMNATVILHESGATDRAQSVERFAFSDGAVRLDASQPLFDPFFYLKTQRDVYASASSNALAHFQSYGAREGRGPNAYFSVSGYLAANPDVAAAHVDPLARYNASGWREGRDPAAAFHTAAYLSRNTDVALAGINPTDHYLASGIYEGRGIADFGAMIA